MATPIGGELYAQHNSSSFNNSILIPRGIHQQEIHQNKNGNHKIHGNASKATYENKHLLPQTANNSNSNLEKGPTVTVNILVTAPDKDKVYRWLIGRNGTNIKLMQSTGVSIQVDRRLGNICLEGDPVLVDKVSQVINRLAADTASSSVGCGGKKVMTAIKRLIADCAAYHSRSSVNPNGSAEVKLISQEVRNTKDTDNYNHFNLTRK